MDWFCGPFELCFTLQSIPQHHILHIEIEYTVTITSLQGTIMEGHRVTLEGYIIAELSLNLNLVGYGAI